MNYCQSHSQAYPWSGNGTTKLICLSKGWKWWQSAHGITWCTCTYREVSFRWLLMLNRARRFSRSLTHSATYKTTTIKLSHKQLYTIVPDWPIYLSNSTSLMVVLWRRLRLHHCFSFLGPCFPRNCTCFCLNHSWKKKRKKEEEEEGKEEEGD